MSTEEADRFLVHSGHAAARDQLNILLARVPEDTDALVRVIDVHIAMH